MPIAGREAGRVPEATAVAAFFGWGAGATGGGHVSAAGSRGSASLLPPPPPLAVATWDMALAATAR